MPRSILQSS